MKTINLAFLISLSICGFSIAETKDYSIDTANPKNQIMFESDAPVESVVGKTSSVWGTISLDADNLSGEASGKIEVDLRTIDTGIGMRNQHMRENHLETETYPTAVFTLKKISATSLNLASGATTDGTVEGSFEIHGVAKDYTIPVTLTREVKNGTDHIWVHANWSITLTDHKIPRPEFLVMKLAEEQKISVQFDMTAK